MPTSSEMVEEEDRVELAADAAEHRRRAPRACARLRGKPSRTNPCARRARRGGSRIIAIVTSSGTRSPRARIASTCLPSSVPAASSARNMSPVETCGIPYSAEMRFACVPCRPLAGRAPASSPQEALVGAHHHLRLHLPHRVERDADDDQHRGAAERARRRLREAEIVDEDATAARRRPRGRASRAASAASARGRGTARSAGPDGCRGCSRRTCAGCRPGRPG